MGVSTLNFIRKGNEVLKRSGDYIPSDAQKMLGGSRLLFGSFVSKEPDSLLIPDNLGGESESVGSVGCFGLIVKSIGMR